MDMMAILTICTNVCSSGLMNLHIQFEFESEQVISEEKIFDEGT